MRNLIFTTMSIAALSACAAPSQPQLAALITQQDMLMNRPDTDRQDAVFRMLPNGQGTVEFLGNPSGPQPVAWRLSGSVFCIEANEGLIASFGCATLNITDGHVTLGHTGSDRVATGVLVSR